jgi:hypothetical protein
MAFLKPIDIIHHGHGARFDMRACNRVGAATAAPISPAGQARMVGVLAHNETRLRCVPTRQQRASAEVAIGDPELPPPPVSEKLSHK